MGKKEERDAMRCTRQEQPLQRETTFPCPELSHPTAATGCGAAQKGSVEDAKPRVDISSKWELNIPQNPLKNKLLEIYFH